MADAVVGTLRAILSLDSAQFDAGAKKASASVSTLGKNLERLTPQAERMVKAFAGDKIITQANNLAAAVQKIGGASRLTNAEQARVNTTITQAIEKYRALGQQAPAALLNLSNATKGASGPTQFLTAKMVALAAAVGAFVSQMAIQAIRALVNFARQSFESASNIVDLANKTGLSTEAIQRMQFVANQTGTSLEAMTEASFRLGVRLEGTSATVKRAVAELGRYGVEWTKLRQMKPEDQFEAVVNALGRVESTQERNRIGVELFGRSFSNVAAAVAEGYGKIAADAKVATDSQLRELDRLNDAWQKTLDNIKTRIGAGLGAAFEELRVRQEVMADVANGLLKPWEATDEIARRLKMLASGAKDVVLPNEQAAAATESYRQQLAKVRAELALLTPAQRAEIAAAIDLGVNTDLLEDEYGLTAGALRILNSQTKDYETNLKKTSDAAIKSAEALKAWHASYHDLTGAFSRWTQVGNDANVTMRDMLGLFRVMPPAIESEAASIEGRLIPSLVGLKAAYAATARARAQLAELMEEGMIGPIAIESEDASGEARHIARANLQQRLEEARIERRQELLNRFFWAVDGVTQQMTDSFGDMLVGLRSFADTFVDIWRSIRRAIANVISGMLQDFIGGYVRRVVAAAAGSALAGAGAGAAIGTGAAAAGAGAGAGTAGVGGGAGAGFLANPAFWTNPYTIAGVAAAAVLTWGITKKGWFRGGEEGTQVNPKRDQFLAQFGGHHALAALLTRRGAGPGGGGLMQALNRADSLRGFRGAEASIASFLAPMRVKQFKFGGFVPPGVTQPAILHGNAFGEDVIPRTSAAQAPPNTVNTLHISISTIDARGVREFVESRDFLDSVSRVFEHNKGFIATRVRPSLVS